MEVILKEDMASLGKIGEVVEVKDGYARNSLIPKGIALEVTPANLKVIEAQRKVKAQHEEEKKQKAKESADKLASISCTVAVATGEQDKLFGTVTNNDIAEALKGEGVVVDKKDIVLEEEIHKLGIYYFKVKLHPEVEQRVKLWVVKE
ncbi:MAG: 50S ribosomal protein L9 [Candidatus Omnitrophica bacterium]|nr:50S ribosomal protein L9 [Candidatus Omnitrophota bacterium]